MGTYAFPDALGVATAGNDIRWRGIVDDQTLGAGATTIYHVELTRPLAAGALGGPGLTVLVLKIGPATVSIDAPGPVLGTDDGNNFAAGETRSVDFHITNDPAGATPAAYFLFTFILWDDGVSPPEGPFVSPVIAVS
jgi:hypothetical protein